MLRLVGVWCYVLTWGITKFHKELRLFETSRATNQTTQRHISEDFEASSTPLYEGQVSHFYHLGMWSKSPPRAPILKKFGAKRPSFRHCYETRKPGHCHKKKDCKSSACGYTKAGLFGTRVCCLAHCIFCTFPKTANFVAVINWFLCLPYLPSSPLLFLIVLLLLLRWLQCRSHLENQIRDYWKVQIFLRLLRFPHVSIIPPSLHIHSFIHSFTYWTPQNLDTKSADNRVSGFLVIVQLDAQILFNVFIYL